MASRTLPTLRETNSGAWPTGRKRARTAKDVAEDNSTETTEVCHDLACILTQRLTYDQINKSTEQAHPRSSQFKSLKMNQPSLLSITLGSQQRLAALAVAVAPYSVAEDNEVQPNGAAGALSNEWDRGAALLKRATNTMTIVEVEEDEVAVLAGKTTISHSEIETPLSTFVQIGQ
jgi:hypothetical protein